MTQTAEKVFDLMQRLQQSLAADATPEPGVYPDTPMATYHAWRAASNSRLSRLHRSPAHLKAYLEQPPADTAALAAGRAIHCAVLEPDEFPQRFVVAQKCTATKKDKERCRNNGTQFWAQEGWRCGVHPGTGPADDSQQVITEGDHAMCLRIRDNVHAHASAGGLVTGEGRNELTLLWRDAETEQLCKARHDRHSPVIAGGAIVDVKSTIDARLNPFERSIFAHGYHRQGAFYLEGAEALELPAQHFVIIAVEKDPPYAVAVYRLTEGALEAGAQQIRQLLRRYAACMATDTWPAYSDDVTDIALPPWAWDVIDTELQGATA
jgi:hypothetical protein